MSYYTRVTFEFSEEPPNADEVSKTVRDWLIAQGGCAVEAILEDFQRGWDEGTTEFSDLVSHDVDRLMLEVSAQYPEVRFFVRGMGEEFDDVWLRQFEGGKVVFQVGPFGPEGE